MKSEIIPHSLPLFNGLIARVAIQCVCPDTGITGSFLFSGDSHRASQSRVSPIYSDLAELFPAVLADWDEVVPGNCAYGLTYRAKGQGGEL